MTNKSLFPNDENIPDIIELSDISQKYGNGENILENLDMLIENEKGKNQVISILGPSGCGKSTILRYISGLQNPTSGNVKLYGKEITNDTVVGMVFQRYSSLPWLSVADNIGLGLELHGVGKKEKKERVDEIIELVGLNGHENKYAQYPTLSGGQLQRVAIARSILASPKILLMDEPFGALDIHTRIKMQDLMRNILSQVEDMAVIFVTHDISEAVYLSNEIFIMQANPGKIVKRIKVNLPENRKSDIKRDSKFLKTVYEIEDDIMSLASENKK
jgi:NitT/TauT family transport system ATP-binding protein